MICWLQYILSFSPIVRSENVKVECNSSRLPTFFTTLCRYFYLQFVDAGHFVAVVFIYLQCFCTLVINCSHSTCNVPFNLLLGEDWLQEGKQYYCKSLAVSVTTPLLFSGIYTYILNSTQKLTEDASFITLCKLFLNTS